MHRLLILLLTMFTPLSALTVLDEYYAHVDALKTSPTEHVLLISAGQQIMTHYVQSQPITKYLISTAANGLGADHGSYKTPLGLHRIRDKIGGQEPPYTIFEARRPTGRTWSKLDADRYEGKDLILSRILRLEGLDAGQNRGNNSEGKMVDSYDRFIYIHGTNQEDRLGSPASLGCIRMRTLDIIQLYQRVPPGSHVYISGR